MEYFRDEKGRLVTQRQYERALNRLSFIQRLFNTIDYWLDMKLVKSEIHKALKKGLPVCYIECNNVSPNKVKDVIARLRYLGYDIYNIYIPYGTSLTASFWVRFDKKEEGLTYVSY